MHCLSSKNTNLIFFSLLQIDIMSCKLLSGWRFTGGILLGFGVIVPAFLNPSFTPPAQLLPSCSMLASVSSFMGLQVRLYVFVLCVTHTAFYLPCTSVQTRKTQTPCFYSLSECKHVSAKHAATLDLPQTQGSVQRSPTAALNYINYHRHKTHTLSSQRLQP